MESGRRRQHSVRIAGSTSLSGPVAWAAAQAGPTMIRFTDEAPALPGFRSYQTILPQRPRATRAGASMVRSAT